MLKHSILFIAVALVLGMIIGHYAQIDEQQPQKKPLYWIDSMEPTVHYPGPGKSAMGMELTPVYPDNEAGSSQSSIQISPAVINNLGVRTAAVTRGSLSKGISTVGYVEPDENEISHIHTYADGWIKKLLVKAVGDVVKNKQVVMQLYSPTLVNVQEEYLIALNSKNEALIKASYKRLLSFNISEKQIQQLKTTRKSSQLIDINAHSNGVVTLLNVREGMYVTAETDMMSIADLSTVWVIAQVAEEQANWVRTGGHVQASFAAFPEKIWQGEITYIYPEVDLATHTLKVRFRFKNPEGLLKPNMYANIVLLAKPEQNVLSIPLEALIRSSSGDRVIVALGEGRFESRRVKAGFESENRIEILSGLTEGEHVVVSGQFLLDSESNLKESMERLQTPAPIDNSKAKVAP